MKCPGMTNVPLCNIFGVFQHSLPIPQLNPTSSCLSIAFCSIIHIYAPFEAVLAAMILILDDIDEEFAVAAEIQLSVLALPDSLS